ncbi:O-antigen ligase family protein [Pseudohoeflea suaedae]|uniref:O-antigen ligase family protein n=1 Tax=Pseudohoeflea suaedae TaxID=877384 RepID=A0A4R5PQ80_9HYPH|nr:O-antigen ligase [Pseudohoeflea suaedae]TDH38787.1 O-antigen ligase family protein [Pseudohoeflea suaedae]
MAQAPTTYGQLSSGFGYGGTERLSTSSPLIRLIIVILCFAGLSLILISLRPFQAQSIVAEIPDSGDQLKQVGFLAAGLVFGLALLTMADPRRIRSLMTPSFALLGGLIAFEMLRAPDGMATVRALILTVIGMMMTLALIILPRTERDFRSALALAAIALMAVSYAGIILLPDLAIHGYDAYEPQHAGLWRGPFSHKNAAGPVMSVITIFGIYMFRSGMRFSGLVVALAAFVFVLKTGSKTTSGFLPLSILIIGLAAATGKTWIAILVHVVAFSAAAVLTLGAAFDKGIFSLVRSLLGDGTYTGRTTLWEFNASMVPNHLWFGYGYDNFWLKPPVLSLDEPFWAAWDYRYIIHGHENFLDILNNLGVVGGSIVFWVLFIGPLFNYAKARKIPNNRKLADMFATIIVFLTLMSLLETFFLRRVDPIWAMHSLAVFGLHITARFDLGGIHRRRRKGRRVAQA